MRATERSTGSPRAPCRWLAAVGLAVTIGLLPSPATAETGEGGAASSFFFGMTAGLLTLVYTPIKVVYAVTAIPVSGLTYVWSVGDSEMAGRVLTSGTQGTFVVTPGHLKGKASLDFVGAADEGPREDEEPSR